MARIVGVDLPKNKRGEISLTYIYGIGRSRAQSILDAAGVDRNIKVSDWNDDMIAATTALLKSFFPQLMAKRRNISSSPKLALKPMEKAAKNGR